MLIADGLALGEEAAQAGVFGGAGVEIALEFVGPSGVLFGPDAVGDGCMCSCQA